MTALTARLRILAFAILGSGYWSSSMVAQEPARLTLVKELTLDAKKENFSVVNGVRANARGDIALTLRQDYSVLVFDSQGRRVASTGRKGSGPGEFQSPQAQGWIGDTVWIYDSALRRHLLFTRNGVHVRTTLDIAATQRVALSNDSGGAFLTGFFPQVRRVDGTLLGTATVARSNRKPGAEREGILAGITAKGVGFKISALPQDTRWERTVAFVDFWAWKPDGSEAVIIGVSDLTEVGSSITIARVDYAGNLLDRSHLPYHGRPIAPVDRDRVLKQPRPHGLDQVARGTNPSSCVTCCRCRTP